MTTDSHNPRVPLLGQETQAMFHEMWEAFCTLSDAQELIAMGRPDDANDMINHAKLHLLRIQVQHPEAHRNAVGAASFEPCILTIDNFRDRVPACQPEKRQAPQSRRVGREGRNDEGHPLRVALAGAGTHSLYRLPQFPTATNTIDRKRRRP